VVQQILARHGYVVLAANGGEEALAQAHSGAIDLIATDVVMPGLGGRELVEAAQRGSPGPQGAGGTRQTARAESPSCGALAVAVQFRQEPLGKILSLGQPVPQIPPIGPRHFHFQLGQVVVQEIPEDLGLLLCQSQLHTRRTSVTSSGPARSRRSR